MIASSFATKFTRLFLEKFETSSMDISSAVEKSTYV